MHVVGYDLDCCKAYDIRHTTYMHNCTTENKNRKPNTEYKINEC